MKLCLRCPVGRPQLRPTSLAAVSQYRITPCGTLLPEIASDSQPKCYVFGGYYAIKAFARRYPRAPGRIAVHDCRLPQTKTRRDIPWNVVRQTAAWCAGIGASYSSLGGCLTVRQTATNILLVEPLIAAAGVSEKPAMQMLPTCLPVHRGLLRGSSGAIRTRLGSLCATSRRPIAGGDSAADRQLTAQAPGCWCCTDTRRHNA